MNDFNYMNGIIKDFLRDVNRTFPKVANKIKKEIKNEKDTSDNDNGSGGSNPFPKLKR